MIDKKAFCILLLTIVVSSARTGVATAEFKLNDVKPAFELQNRNGEIVRFNEFNGKHVLLAFGFTHCAHVCPMIAANMARALQLSSEDAIGIFISVDTERDSATKTDDYARAFGGHMLGLSGTYKQIADAAKNFNVTFVVTKSEDHYTVQHTPSIFLLSPDGELIDVFALNTPPSKIADSIR